MNRRQTGLPRLARCAWLLILLRQVFVLAGIVRSRRFLRDRSAVLPAAGSAEATIVVVVPVLREASGLPSTVGHLSRLAGPGRTVVVTTEREAGHPSAPGLSTVEVAAALAAQGRCRHLHAPTVTGVKADQLNWAAGRLADDGYDASSTFVLVYDADSRPGPQAVPNFRAGIAAHPSAPVFHTSSLFEHRPSGRPGPRDWLPAAAALRANRFVLGFEIPRLLARMSTRPVRHRLANKVFAHVTGHGLCVRLDYLLAHPFPAGDPIEDMHWSFHLCARGEAMIAVPDLDRAEVPGTVAAQLRQGRRWFSGPGRSLHYAREGGHRPASHELLLALSGMASAAEWLACAVVPALLGISVFHRRDRVAGAVLGLLMAQFVVVDTTLGRRRPADAVGVALMLPVTYTLQGLGGWAGAIDIVRSRYRTDKTERS